MTDLKDQVETALNEGRMLVLGVQVLLGFAYQSVFQSGFERLARPAQYLHLAGLGLLLLAMAGSMAPAPFHRLACRGQVTPALLRFTSRVVGWSLLPLSLALGLNVYVVSARLYGPGAGLAAGLFSLAVTLFAWYGWEFWVRAVRLPAAAKENRMDANIAEAPPPTPLPERIKQVLMEARIVLPGVQALLGFQFITIFTDAFERLPAALQALHLASLSCIGLSMVLLIMPAAYHRLVEQGQDTERLHRLSTRLLLGAMLTFGLGLALETWVVTEKVSRSRAAGLGMAGFALLVLYGLWFGYSWYRRESDKRIKNP